MFRSHYMVWPVYTLVFDCLISFVWDRCTCTCMYFYGHCRCSMHIYLQYVDVVCIFMNLKYSLRACYAHVNGRLSMYIWTVEEENYKHKKMGKIVTTEIKTYKTSSVVIYGTTLLNPDVEFVRFMFRNLTRGIHSDSVHFLCTYMDNAVPLYKCMYGQCILCVHKYICALTVCIFCAYILILSMNNVFFVSMCMEIIKVTNQIKHTIKV